MTLETVTPKRFPARSELRDNYSWIESWIDRGMTPEARVAFTEGDLRLAGQLCENAAKRIRRNEP